MVLIILRSDTKYYFHFNINNYKYKTMNQNVWPFGKKKNEGFPIYVEMPSVVNNIIAQQLEESKAKYRAIVNNKKSCKG